MRTPILALLLLMPTLTQAQMYRWVDESGSVHFSDRIPPSGAKDVQKKSMPAAQSSTASLPYALQQAVGNFPVTLYTSEVCKETCSRARALLDKRGVPYSEVTVRTESELAQLKRLSGDVVVPVMTVGHEVYKGFERGNYQTALDVAGYPASSLLPPGVQARKLVSKPVSKAPAVAGNGKAATTSENTAGNAAVQK
jgi:glutaredoxin